MHIIYCGMKNMTDAKKRNLYLMFIPLSGVLLASAWHFLYDLVPCPFVGAFAPVNESVWEHLKIVFYPFLILWLVGYVFKYSRVDTVSYALAGTVGAAVAAMSVVAFDYFVNGILGVKQILPVHIINCAAAFAAGAALGYPITKISDRNAEIIIPIFTALIVAACVYGSVSA